MKQVIAVTLPLVLAACQSSPPLEDDTRYVKLAKVVDVHVFTETERKEAKQQQPSDSSVGVGIGVGVGSGVGFGGVMFGTGGHRDTNEAPQVANGANRFTVETLDKAERIEVLSYGKYKVGDCVKVLTGHPSEYARLFDLKPGERCD